VKVQGPVDRRTHSEARRFDKVIPGSYAVCTISFDDPDSDAATYGVVEYGYDTAEEVFRGLDGLKKSREYAKADLVVIQHVDRDAEA
jgi:hypothetical protein